MTWIEVAGTAALLLSLAWLVTDTVRARRHNRDVCALLDRIQAQGGEWTAEDHAAVPEGEAMSTSRFWGVLGALLIGTGIGRMAGASNVLLAPEWTIALGVAMWVVAGIAAARKARAPKVETVPFIVGGKEVTRLRVVTTTIREEKR